MSESERHFKAVVLEHLGNGDTPEQSIFESSAGDRRSDKMAGPDPRHHQDHAWPKVSEQGQWANRGKLKVFQFFGVGRCCGLGGVVGHRQHVAEFARIW